MQKKILKTAKKHEILSTSWYWPKRNISNIIKISQTPPQKRQLFENRQKSWNLANFMEKAKNHEILLTFHRLKKKAKNHEIIKFCQLHEKAKNKDILATS